MNQNEVITTTEDEVPYVELGVTLDPRVRIQSHNNGASARLLAQGRKLLRKSPQLAPSGTKVVYNMGCSTTRGAPIVVNSPDLVTLCKSKRTFLDHFTRTSESTALQMFMIPSTSATDEVFYSNNVEGTAWVARTVDNGSSGNGIVMIEPRSLNSLQDIPRAAVYTKYIKKAREYRVHICNGKIIDVQRKILSDTQNPIPVRNRPPVWNHDNGYIFVRDSVNENTVPRNVLVAARSLMYALRNYGHYILALDIIVPYGTPDVMEAPAYLLEANTAPGMSPATAKAYIKALNAIVNQEPIPEWEPEVNQVENAEG